MEDINRYIEHTNLKPSITGSDIDQLVRDGLENKFVGICIPPFWVKRASREIGEMDLQLVTVIGFPLGYQMTEAKMKETELAIRDGANELDIVMNISAFKSGMPWVKIELAKLSKFIHEEACIMKVIIETSQLDEAEIIQTCMICVDAGADFVKTSTGFTGHGAKERQVKLMRETVSSNVGVKASGGIKSLEDAIRMINAGADRIGTSSGVSIMNEVRMS